MLMKAMCRQALLQKNRSALIHNLHEASENSKHPAKTVVRSSRHISTQRTPLATPFILYDMYTKAHQLVRFGETLRRSNSQMLKCN